MVDDHRDALGQVFQRFLKEQDDVLADLREALCGTAPVGAGASEALLGHFERWLDDWEGGREITHRATLMQVAKAFVALAADSEGTESLVLV